MSGLVIVNGATALATPPSTAYGLVPANWGNFLVEEFDLELWAAGSTNLTVTELVGATLQAQVLADDDIDSLVTGTDVITSASHSYVTGDGPVQVSTTTTLPAGLTASTDYWINVASANTYTLHPSLATALAGTQAIDITSAGTGTHTISDTSSTMRVHWHSMGLLGNAADGAVTLTSQRSYRVRVKHTPRTIAYSLIGTLSAAVATYCTLYPLPRSMAR
jgi:hypothetical protein